MAGNYAPEYYGGLGGGGVIQDACSETGTQVIYLTRNDSTACSFTVANDYTGYTGLLTIRHRTTDAELAQVAAVVTDATTIVATFTTTDTAFADLVAASEFGPHPFDIELTLGATVTSIHGIAVIRKDQTTA